MRRKALAQQVVVVFGASSGIGRATALRFAQAGARVVVAARGKPGLDSLVEQITAQGGQAAAMVADAADFAQVTAVADFAVRTFGTLDTWVQVAAVYVVGRFQDLTPAEFQHSLNVNTMGQVHGAMAALPHLRGNPAGGTLIHVSSIEAIRAFPYKSAYACSKHAIPGFLDALRVELKHDGVPVDVVNVMPAAINTPLFRKGLSKIGVKPAAPPPIYQPELVADAIVRAATHPQRDIIVGGAGQMFISLHKLCPTLMDVLVGLFGFRGQRSDEAKLPQDRNAFWQPLTDDNAVHGEFNDVAVRHSPYTWLATHRPARYLLLAGAAALLAAALSKGMHSQPARRSGRLQR
ncbi:SDR family oxidoreductase [Chitiniphilus purpureus]|uniref:SDR family oxidoreductase n=1 Tax=Chitiniphilus purpureus TaxID=2981137 RepID=A0ABY6DII8_9NEIS|nr:SDR family oxidoreductase [Chitiniphilus sp. CD1]UXY14154.1 SDR family oxidoreductase [Chitiniphilus sp. CD1]